MLGEQRNWSLFADNNARLGAAAAGRYPQGKRHADLSGRSVSAACGWQGASIAESADRRALPYALCEVRFQRH